MKRHIFKHQFQIPLTDRASALNQQIDSSLVQQAMALLLPAQRIALLAHERPDGDCIGSALGFAHILSQMGKTCVPICVDAPPNNFHFLPGLQTFQRTLPDEHFDLLIALDAGEFSRFGSSFYEQHRTFLDTVPVLNIDHHISSTGCGRVNIIDPISAATAELLVLFQQQAGLPLNQEAALCLLTGIITDTNSFQFTNTTPRTLEVSAALMRTGVIPETIAQPLYRTRSLAQERLRGAVIAHAQTACDGRLIWSYATDATLAATGATSDMDDNSSGILRDIEGVQIAAFFKSYGDLTTTRLSLRSADPYNAAAICQRLAGGGGHARAAGCTFHLPIEQAMAKAIAELEREISGI